MDIEIRKKSSWLPVVAILVLVAVGCPNSPSQSGNSHQTQPSDLGRFELPTDSMTAEERMVYGVTRSEKMLQALSTKVKLLTKVFKEAEPNFDISSISLDEVALNHPPQSADLDLMSQRAIEDFKDQVAYFTWPLSDEVESRSLRDIWSPITKFARFEDAQLGTLKCFFDESNNDFVMETKFEGRLAMKGSRQFGIKGIQVIRWREVGGDWKVVAWNQKQLKVVVAAGSLFENVTNRLFPEPDLLRLVSTAAHEDKIVEQLSDPRFDPKRMGLDKQFPAFSDWESFGQYPTVSTVDFDNDGDDDLFLTDRWQASSLLANQGDGTFLDVTQEAGLSLGPYVNGGCFFDYDNDGDADLLVNCSMRPSQFFTNEGGKFVPHDRINHVLQDTRLVVSASAIDVNRDGLLDLYLCTYAPAMGPVSEWVKKAVSPKEQIYTQSAVVNGNQFVDRGGPPNILLINQGDTFLWAESNRALKQYRNSYQATWLDFDSDGDHDLYICNDFAPDVFLRNDTKRGASVPEFSDVTSEIAPQSQMGFGMGASLGDYDNDGDLDLYVSNMYSKAGNRILSQLDNVDERLIVSARGNFLYENRNDHFHQVAGESDDQQHVNVVGWSFGGQFADFDNDGHLDLYVPSGFYSAPEEVSTAVDL